MHARSARFRRVGGMMDIRWKHGRKGVGALAALALLPRCGDGVAPAASEDPSRSASVQEARTFAAVADAYVDASLPDGNFGAEPRLQLDTAPTEYRAFTRFDVTGLPGRVTRATLRLYAFSGTEDGPAV